MIQMMRSSWKWKCVDWSGYRLEHENYLKEEEYEKLLFPCFDEN